MSARAHGDVGSAAVELAILAPVLALLFAAVIMVGRITSTRDDLATAAQLAARAASQEREPKAAQSAATDAALAGLPVGAGCRTPQVSAPYFTAEYVSLTVTCTVEFRPFPGGTTISETWSEPLDWIVERTS